MRLSTRLKGRSTRNNNADWVNKAMRHAVRPSFIVNGDVIPESEKVKYLDILYVVI